MEGICSVCSILQGDKLGSAIHSTQQIAVNLILSIDPVSINSVDRDDLSKALLMLTGCVKALETLPFATLKPVLLPMISSVWPNLCKILEAKYQDVEVVEHICNLIQRILKALNLEVIPLFESLSRTLIQVFAANPQNIKCLKMFSYAC